MDPFKVYYLNEIIRLDLSFYDTNVTYGHVEQTTAAERQKQITMKSHPPPIEYFIAKKVEQFDIMTVHLVESYFFFSWRLFGEHYF